MPSTFLQQFMAGWSMGQQRNEAQRRDQMVQADMEREAFDRQLRQEQLTLAKKRLQAEEQQQKIDNALAEKQRREAALSETQAIAQMPPTAAEIGIQQKTPVDVGPTLAEINVPQPTQAIPSVTGGPDIMAPVLTGPQQQAVDLAAQQKKVREALGLLNAQEAIKAQYREQPKTLDQIRAEARARAEGSLAAGASGEGDSPGYLDATAQGLANYEIGLGDLGRMGKGEKAMAFALAKKKNPSFNASLYQSRQKLRADFTSGKTANNIDSLNTAVDHINTLAEYTKALNNGNVPFANQIAQTFATATGNPAATNYKTMATAVESEVASLLKKTGATDQEINSWRANFSAAGSPAQLEGSIKTVLKVMRGREQALQQRWKTGMGTGEEYPIYGEEQRAILDSLGYSGQGGAGTGGGGEWQTVAGGRVRKKAR